MVNPGKKKIAKGRALLLILSLGWALGFGGADCAGQEEREIKSLSTEEIESYLSGDGMGLAKAAELNHYPGPRHVLDWAEKLRLAEKQLARTKEIYQAMHQEAVALGKLIVEKERMLNGLFVDRKIDKTQLDSLVSEIAKFQGNLRATHLTAHLQMKEVLSPEQIAAYDAIRGYVSTREQELHRH